MSSAARVAVWVAGLALGMALGAGVVRVLCGAVPMRDVSSGWLLVALNSAAMLAINRRAARAGRSRFLAWGVAANTLRLAAVVAILLVYGFAVPAGLLPFAMAVVTGALVAMAAEVVCLHRESVDAGNRPQEGVKP